MNLNSASQMTGYYLAHPKEYNEVSYRAQISYLDYPETGVLNSSLRIIRKIKLIEKELEVLDSVDLPMQIRDA